MQDLKDSTSLDVKATAVIALKDTQEDEYYSNTSPEGLDATDKSLIANPYPGLRPFKTSESHVFFGRKDITLDLIERLAAHRFLGVLGASGSGKSSLVRAGLLPSLKNLPGKHSRWKIAICRPGNNPFGNLAVAIDKAGIVPGLSALEIWQSISSSSYGFEEMFSKVNTADECNTLIVVDQFEELFRFKKDNGINGKNDAALFVKMLIDLTKIEAFNAYVMITMRSDYLGDCVQFPDLVDEINAGQFLVPRLKLKQLKDAIMQPASFSNASVDALFADRLIGEIGDDMDQLPVLQHALRRSYQKAKENEATRGFIKITYADYNEIGRMENALDQHAKEIMQQFSDDQKQYCRILFQSITDRATDGRGIRRPLDLKTIFKICQEFKPEVQDKKQMLADIKKVIDCFRADNVNFLMPPETVPLKPDTRIDISHESLMRIWKDLKDWISAEAKDADLLSVLLKRNENDYFTGANLLSYKDWLITRRNAIRWVALYKPKDNSNLQHWRKFSSRTTLVDLSVKYEKEGLEAKENASKKLFEAELKATRESMKAEQEGLKARRRRRYIVLMLLLVAVAVGAAISLFNLNNQLDKNKNDLLETNSKLLSKNDTINRQVANLNKLNDSLEENKTKLNATVTELSAKKTILEAQHARIAMDSALLSTRNDSLKSKLGQLKTEQLRSTALNDSLQETSKKLLAVTTSRAQSLQNLALAVKHAEKSLAIPVYDSSRNNIKAQLALISYKLLLQSGKDEIDKLQPQIYSGLYNAIKSTKADDEQLDIITPYKANTDRVARASFSSNQNNHSIIHLAAEDKNIYSFDLQNRNTNNNVLGNGNKKTIFSIDADRQGNWLAINTMDSILFVKNLHKNNIDTLVFRKAVRCTKFSPDGKNLFVYTKDKLLYNIDLNNMQSHFSPTGTKIEFDIQNLAISNGFLYGVTSYGNIAKWNRKNGLNEKNFLTRQPDSVTIPKNNKGELYRGTAVGCSANDSIVVWGNEHGEVFYYAPGKSRAGQNLTRFGGPVTDIAFSESGRYLAVSSFDKSVKIFQLPEVQAAAPIDIRSNEGAIMTISFQHDAKTNAENLIAVMSPGLVRIFPMDLSDLAAKVKKMVTKDISPLERTLYFDAQVPDSLIEKHATDKN